MLEGVVCLPNEEIFAGLAQMGYKKPSTKLTFYKAFFSSQWKFLIHTILQSLSTKRTSWNEFSTAMASAVICLSKGQKFNFSKYIFDSLVRNVDSSSKFYMYPRFIQLIIQNRVGDLSTHTTRFISPALTHKVFANMRRVGKGFSGVETPLFEGMLAARQLREEGLTEEQVQADDVVGAAVQENVAENVAHDAIPSPPSHNISSPSQLEIIKLKARVKMLEKANMVKSSKLRCLRKVRASRRIESFDDMEDVFNQGRMIDDMDKDEGIELVKDADIAKIEGRHAAEQAEKHAEIYNLDMDHSFKVLSMQEDDSEVQEVVEIVTTAKLITDVVTAASQVSAASATISAAKPSIPAAAPTVVVAYTRRRKRVIIRDPEEELSSKTPAETPKMKDKGKGILIETPKPMKKKDQIKLDAEYAKKLHEEINKDHEEFNKDIYWDGAMDYVNKKSKNPRYIKRYQGMKKRPQTESEAHKNMMIYLRTLLATRWISLKECRKANVVTGALSRKERAKPRRVRAMSMTIHSSIKAKILEAQSEASKNTNTLTEMLKGLDKQLERKEDGRLYLAERIWVLVYGDLRTLIMNEAHAMRYSVHPGAEKMSYDLRGLYWWPRMKKDIAMYVIQQPEIPEWKWEKITMDFINKLPRTRSGHDSIRVIVDRLTKSAHFLAVREDYKTEKLARLYINKIIARHSEVLNAHSLDRSGRRQATWTRGCPRDYRQDCSNKGKIKVARDRQKSYADNCRKPLEFSVGDKVLLKVSTRKGAVRFGKRSKLSPRYVGPFKIAERIDPVAYRLRLPQELVGVHDMFHVSSLKKCLADVNLHVPLDEVKVDDKLQFVKEPIEILDRGVKKLKRGWIPIVKRKYPHLFASAPVGRATEISGQNSL
nr:retrotransposon protein, putative, Ty3-gypsy subclass [Tanacetum cinerariifolium]